VDAVGTESPFTSVAEDAAWPSERAGTPVDREDLRVGRRAAWVRQLELRPGRIGALEDSIADQDLLFSWQRARGRVVEVLGQDTARERWS
jgi:hypothetical protein